MVRPGMINLDFADVETVMTSMGKAMMGTGEAEGENRAMNATEMALNNPLIDEYSLQGAKGLLVNITGGKDITLFEVDQAVNKIRAEVDPEAELIFGAIKDENLNGKMRVSIVATALDGQKPETNTILNMVDRIQNRNTGYSDSLFTKNTHIENNTFNSINGANALKLDQEFEVREDESSMLNSQSELNLPESTPAKEENSNGISIESASYIENSLGKDSSEEQEMNSANDENQTEEEYTPKLFSEEITIEENIETSNSDEEEQLHSENLLNQDSSEDEDFEIPAFLRRQKF
jgi:cell division protein FtsZ